MLTRAKIEETLAGAPLGRIVLEVKEHLGCTQYGEIAAALAPLRRRGLRLSLATAGGGFAAFRHVMGLQPDIVKISMSLVRGIHGDAARRALVVALIRFSAEQGIGVVAEGVETLEERDCLRSLGVSQMQGYLLGRPIPVEIAGRQAADLEPLACAA